MSGLDKLNVENMTAEELKAAILRLKAEKAAKEKGVEVVEYTPKSKIEAAEAKGKETPKAERYVKTRAFPMPDGTTAKGLFLRVEALDAAIEALTAAKAVLG